MLLFFLSLSLLILVLLLMVATTCGTQHNRHITRHKRTGWLTNMLSEKSNCRMSQRWTGSDVKQTILFVPVERKHWHQDGEAEKFRQCNWDRTKGLWLCAPALWPLNCHAASANCTEQSIPRRLPMSALPRWVTAMLQSTANSGRHHEMLCGVRIYKELITQRGRS